MVSDFAGIGGCGNDCLAAGFIQTMMAPQAMNASVADLIRAEIAKNQIISFARFMDLALYAPGVGFYEQHGRVGRCGDFYTSVSVGPVFGELLGFQFAEWLENFRGDCILEGGAHDGQLAADILSYLQVWRPDLAGRLNYILLEPSAVRRGWQEDTLRDFENIQWKSEWREVKKQSIRGVIFGNELLDAFPVHRLGWDKEEGRWFEWGVVTGEAGFAWARMETPGLKALRNETFQVPIALRECLPDGFVTVSCPMAANWWQDAADRLGQGRLLAFDYGLEAEEFFLPEREGGTLRAYIGQRASADLLACPGGQDLTASVNFTVIRAMGELAGLASRPFVSQEKFLMRIFEQTLTRPEKFPKWTEERRHQFQTLVHPEHLGRPFQVFEQIRG
tara:strand:- start:553 stop:1725 length:1173 start_codon:yes stop_codon:yes gene_type:complete